MPLVRLKRFEMAAALEHLRMLSGQEPLREVGGRLCQLSEAFGRNVAAPAARLDPRAEAEDERRTAAIGEHEAHLAIGLGATLLRGLAQSIEAADRRTGACNARQCALAKNVPIARGREALRQPSGLRPQRFEPAQGADRLHQVEGGAEAAQRDAQLMDPFSIAAVFGGRQRLKKMVKAGAQDRCKGVVERDRRLEAELARLGRGGRRIGRKIIAACGLAADGRPDRPVLAKSKRHVVNGARATALELQLDLVDLLRAIARFQDTVVEGNLDRAGRQIDDALMAVDVGCENRPEAVTLKIGSEVLGNERHCQCEIRRKRWHARLPLASPQRIACGFQLHGLHESRAALANPQGQSVALQGPCRRIVVDALQMLARALAARMGRDDARVIEIREAIGFDKELQFDLGRGGYGGRRRDVRCRRLAWRRQVVRRTLRDRNRPR
jgi:hypothetical protein